MKGGNKVKENIKLDNLTCQEIKEMIYDNRIELTSLETSVLQRLMDNEIGLLCFGEGDEELIDKCAETICERDTSMMSHDQFMSIIDRLEKGTTAQEPKTTPTKRFSFKRALVIAAAVSAIVIGGTMVASAFGFNLFEYISEIARQPDGTEKEANGLTFYNAGETKKYASLKEAVENENLNIMYPASMPDGDVIEIVRITDSVIGDKNIQISSLNDSVIIVIDTNVTPNDNMYQGNTVYKKDNINYVLYEKDLEYKYGAYCNVNNCAYIIQTKEYQDLIYIIENMEENQ